ncbi:adenosylcobinamide-GDP ribazoletransferase [Xanthomonas campestris pv. raphani]|uniref:adenosylcobinamide-GDP ribazoletransferase n=1 Tax=Xanthomonas campestris TaxID=339 RepID=UPI002B231946|nr:adenosylcobinamide-GDP ribazoletransferase [Xanthomonas campestris]MEA9773344.1 adenosylcobinamide-GDP ribazoletransferase [Xanthomonas campestris pv. raphani]MEA9801443.1 adenosylcobinamide-GDP ribazoletransferase [Xanthomonas campestris pv. raphani]MEA9831747.1 adenosylcobinamide-GDP ribazoletransferase [Xanthomonas campestris pv. raphani]MEA9950812.1 adenosylcobinamide-GDP ribazoletransferase [Xanthomonas campestris pv. raphani]MEA9952012.1 adenosylcobinamide-GDP ribazoletransferase [Xan
MIDGLLAAVGFLTRIPVPAWAFARPGAQARSLPWYPLVGLLLGVLLLALAWCLRGAAPLLAAAIVLSSWVWLTGALHVDGLADSTDAWVGGMGDRARTLAIMKDPTSGPMAVTAVVLMLLLKCAALTTLLPAAPAALWLAPLLARAAVVAAFASTPYVRAGGLGSALAGASRTVCVLAVAVAVGVACVAGPARAALACMIAALVFALWRRACLHRLGGMTGDTCGALIELSETAVLVGLAVYAG